MGEQLFGYVLIKSTSFRDAAIASLFSSSIHNEVFLSTASAQLWKVFLLPSAMTCLRVSPANTWQFSSTCPNDVCGDAGGSRQFSRVNCRGKLEPRVSAYRLPGHCGLLRTCSTSRLGCWLPQWLWSCVSPNRKAATSTGKSGTHRERCRAGAVDPLLLAAGG